MLCDLPFWGVLSASLRHAQLPRFTIAATNFDVGLACATHSRPPLLWVHLLSKKLGKKKHFEDGKHDEELDEYHQPQLLTQCHAPKTIIVKVERAIPKAFLVHSYCNVYNVQI